MLLAQSYSSSSSYYNCPPADKKRLIKTIDYRQQAILGRRERSFNPGVIYLLSIAQGTIISMYGRCVSEVTHDLFMPLSNIT